MHGIRNKCLNNLYPRFKVKLLNPLGSNLKDLPKSTAP